MAGPSQSPARPNRVPLYVGLAAALVAIALSLFGMIKNAGPGTTPLTLQSLALVILIAGGSWGIVAWAITTAIYDVEADVAGQAEEAPERKG